MDKLKSLKPRMNESRDRKLILCANQNGDHYVEENEILWN